jgi:DNA-binding transcriptional ArsR family regulator
VNNMNMETPGGRVGQSGPLDEFQITDIKTLRVMAHPIRLELLERLARPATVTELAESLGVPRTRLYRHLHALREVGLVDVVSTRQVRAMVESVYRAVARSFVPGPSLLTTGSMEEIGEAVLTTVFDTTRADLKRRLDSGRLSLDQREANPRTVALGRFSAFLSLEEAASIVERLESLAAEVEAKDGGSIAGEQFYTMQFVFYPAGSDPE